MDVWTKILSKVEDQSLLLLGLVTVLVVYSCFKLLSQFGKLVILAYTETEKQKAQVLVEAERQKTQALVELAIEVKRGNEICHLHTSHLDQIIRQQNTICHRVGKEEV